MSGLDEYSCFIGNLSLSTTSGVLKDAFGERIGHVTEAKVIRGKSGRSRRYGFVTFEDKESVEVAIKEMDGKEIGKSSISVAKARRQTAGSDCHGNHEHDCVGDCFTAVGSRGDIGRSVGILLSIAVLAVVLLVVALVLAGCGPKCWTQ